MGKNQFEKIIALVCLLFFFESVFAKTIVVDKKSINGSIINAIKIASPHDTIQINSGIYFEKNIVIRKPVVIRGVGHPVIDGESKFEILSIMSSDVTVEGIEFRHGGRSSVNDLAGVKVYISRNVFIRNNILNEMFFGIYFQACTNCWAVNNIIHSTGNTEVQSGNGIHCWKSDSMHIINNRITGQRDGIYFEFVTNSRIENNVSEMNIRYGLHFMFSHFNSYTNNTFNRNGAGVAVMYTHDIKMYGNTFSNNWGGAAYGLLLKDISNSTIINNKFIENTTGIYMEGSSRLKMNNNEFSSNGYALKIQASCDDNVITENNFTGNTFDVTTNGSLVQNDFDGNYWDKYDGYDLDRNGIGDVPHHPVNMYSMIVEKMPIAMIFFRSFLVDLLDRSEKAMPSLTPDNFRDNTPHMKRIVHA
jgi:nitrous oxidase accessory protein